MTKVACIGAGSWGTTVAALAARNAHEVLLWCRRDALAEQINTWRTNDDYLPGIQLPEGLRATAELEEAVTGADAIVMGVPSHGWRNVLQDLRPFVASDTPFVSLTKGLEEGSNLRMSEVLADEWPDFVPHRYAILTGPNIAREIARSLPAASVIGCSDEACAKGLQEIFHQPSFRVYTNTDVVGCELGGAIKNVIAIAAGITDQFNLGDNARAALMTRGLAELTRLGVHLGGRTMTFAGLGGMGDLLVTCISKYSRNRRVGKELGKGRKIEDIISEMKMVAEGVKTCRPILDLGNSVGAWMPITEGVVSVIYEGVSPQDMIANMLARPPAAEGAGIDDG